MAELSVELRGDDQVWLSGPCDPAAYARLCDPLVRAGRVAHYVEVRADDAAELDRWYGLSFGRQQVYAEQPVRPARDESPRAAVRPGTLEDALALGDVIGAHQEGPPVWARPSPWVGEALRQVWAEELAEPGRTYLVAELDGRLAGYALLVRKSDEEALLEVQATVPAARGRGVGRALFEAMMRAAHADGHGRLTIDWRSTNLEAARFWTARGFLPTRYRLHRLVGR